MDNYPFRLLSFSGKMKILHLSWMAFLISFIAWFNHAPLMLMIQQDIGLSQQEINIILLLNVALTIPARIITGLAVDRFGARLCYSILLASCSIPCFMFALAENFAQLAWARFLLGFIGAGFVIGIRIISDWFPARQLGTAEGIYAGWGNFGSGLAAMVLPGLALFFGEEHGWRYAAGLSGLLALIFSAIYYLNVSDFPEHKHGPGHRSSAIMEVTSIHDLFLYIVAMLPLYGAMSLITWNLAQPAMPLLSFHWVLVINTVIWCTFFFHARKMVDLNAQRLTAPVAEVHRYRFKQVVILSLAYLMTFGAKLAMVSMLPIFFYDTFKLTHQMTAVGAGMLASSFIFLNLIARPAGGWISDRFGRKISLFILTSGLALSFLLMAQINANWPIFWAIVVTLICSIFMQATEGAIFAVVPLVKRSITGQVAGIVGAYGNAGTIVFLTLLTVVSATDFFIILAVCTLLLLAALHYLEEPKSIIMQVLPNGTWSVIKLD